MLLTAPVRHVATKFCRPEPDLFAEYFVANEGRPYPGNVGVLYIFAVYTFRLRIVGVAAA